MRLLKSAGSTDSRLSAVMAYERGAPLLFGLHSAVAVLAHEEPARRVEHLGAHLSKPLAPQSIAAASLTLKPNVERSRTRRLTARHMPPCCLVHPELRTEPLQHLAAGGNERERAGRRAPDNRTEPRGQPDLLRLEVEQARLGEKAAELALDQTREGVEFGQERCCAAGLDENPETASVLSVCSGFGWSATVGKRHPRESYLRRQHCDDGG